MNVRIIGQQIAALRKERGVKQEKLAAFVGVSAQAVSKWENGGVPDTALLPKIAEFFGVSIDCLFGRETFAESDYREGLMKAIVDSEDDKRYKLAFEDAWLVEKALLTKTVSVDDDVEYYTQKFKDSTCWISYTGTGEGFTRMSVTPDLNYFLLVPMKTSLSSSFFSSVDYRAFFAEFSKPKVIDACILLDGRDPTKAFTPALLSKKLGIDEKAASEIVAILCKYRLATKEELELDDETRTICYYKSPPEFTALMIFVRELAVNNKRYTYYSDPNV